MVISPTCLVYKHYTEISSYECCYNLMVAGNGGKKIKIPDVCSHFDVSCMTINEVLRELQITV